MVLLFFGSGAFAATVLERLAAVHSVAFVITSPPAPAGRKMTLTPCAAEKKARALGIQVLHEIPPRQIELRELQRQMFGGKMELLRDVSPQMMRQMGTRSAKVQTVVCDYGKILSADMLDAVSGGKAGGALNIHPSLLPRWRGATPIERAVLAGDVATGVTIMRMNEQLDSGDILAQWAMPLGDEWSAAALAPRLAEQGAALLLQVLAAPQDYPPRKQVQGRDEARVSYAGKIMPHELRLDFNETAAQCRRRVLAFSPQPGAYFLLGDERLRVLSAAAVQGAEGSAEAGTLLAADEKQGMVVACGEGALAITEVQRAGRRAMPVAAFLRGYSLREYIGKRFLSSGGGG